MTYITVNEASEKWNIGERRICILCKNGRIPGAVKKSRIWMIPENATKPEDGRKVDVKEGIDPALLIYNPTYPEGKLLKLSPMDASICEIQEKFLHGQLQEALEETNRMISICSDNKYLMAFYFLKYIICADIGKAELFIESGNECFQKLFSRPDFKCHQLLVSYYLGNSEYIDTTLLTEEHYDAYVPLISLVVLKKAVTGLIQRGKTVDVSGMELICRELQKRECPLITAYSHLYLTIYYHLTGISTLFEYHLTKALEICLPRKWYTPIAEYSAILNLDFLKTMDLEAYKHIIPLSETIISSYIAIGLFDSVTRHPKLDIVKNVQIGYRLAQGKNVNTIAKELGISQYKVKQHIEDLYSITGASSKKEIKDFILKNLFV